MPFNTKSLKTDASGKFIPQTFNGNIDDYQVLQTMEFYGKSTDPKPANNSVPVGATFFEIDTQNAFMNDGSTWVVLD